MGQNFDDYPGSQQIPGMPILLQQSIKEPICNDTIYFFLNDIKGSKIQSQYTIIVAYTVVETSHQLFRKSITVVVLCSMNRMDKFCPENS